MWKGGFGMKEKKLGGRLKGARGMPLLWEAKTAAALKLPFSATLPQGCVFSVFIFCLHRSECVCVCMKKTREKMKR